MARRFYAKKTRLMTFRRLVLARCERRCEVPGCVNRAESVHHMLKASTYPGLKFDIDNGLGVCGMHHVLIEQMLRKYPQCTEEVPKLYYPSSRWTIIKEKK